MMTTISAGTPPVGTTVRWIGSKVNARFYYPARWSHQSQSDDSQRAHWISSPQSVYLRGYARFLGLDVRPIRWLFRLLFRSIRMEAVEDLSPDVSRRLPVLILSHGLGGTATAYAKLCCSVASNGWLVLALEHQDGTASATVSFSGTPRYYQRPNVRDSETKRRQARRIQLDQRCQEIQQVIEWLHDSGEVPADDPLLQSLHQVIDSAQITLCGHSFGGATVARWCYTMEARRFPLKYCILLDPWFWPLLEEDGRLPSLMDQPTPTLIVVNELFFQSVTPAEREALRSWPALHRLMLLGAAHQVQSDFEHRLPRCVVRLAQLASQRDPMLLFHVQMEMIMAFIKGNQALFNRIPENHPDMLQRLE